MKKTLKLLLSSVMLISLIAGMQITAFAAVASPGEILLSHDNVGTDTDVNAVSEKEADNLPNVTAADIQPISANPQTGAESLAVPAVVALLAASTAAIALSLKKREK